MDVGQKKFGAAAHEDPQTPTPQPAGAGPRPARALRVAGLGSLAKLPDELILDHILPMALRLSEQKRRGAGAETLHFFAGASPVAATLALGATAYIHRTMQQLEFAWAAGGLTQDPRGPDPSTFVRHRALLAPANAAANFATNLVRKHPLQIIRNVYAGEAASYMFAPAMAQLEDAYPHQIDAVHARIHDYLGRLDEQNNAPPVRIWSDYHGQGAGVFAQAKGILADDFERHMALARSQLLGTPLLLDSAQYPLHQNLATDAQLLLTEAMFPQNSLMMAQRAYAQENWRSTIHFASDAAQRWPESIESHFLLGLAQYKLCNFRAADAALSQVIALDPSRLDAVTERALVRFQQGRYKDVVAELGDIVHNRALSYTLSHERITRARTAVADSYLALKKFTLAEQHLVTANILAPGNTHTLTSLGQLYILQGRPQNSFYALLSAIRRDDNNGAAHALLGKQMLDFGLLQQAVEHLGRAADLGVTEAEPLVAEAAQRLQRARAAR